VRRLILIFSAGFVAFGFVSVTTLAAGAQTTGGGSSLLEGGTKGVSQGTVSGASRAELDAVQRELAREDRLPDYSQVVDNTTARRFAAPGWKAGGTDDLAHGGSYAASTAGAKGARFKLKVPTSGTYSVYAWWPLKKDNSASARFGVVTSSGTKWTTVDQTTDGGTWIPIGTYDMRAGDYNAVNVSAGNGPGRAVADAVALVRGMSDPPPDDLAPADGGRVSAGVRLKSDNVTYSVRNRSGRVNGRKLVREGMTHLDTPYVLSPPGPCEAYVKEDCSCFTSNVLMHFGKSLPDSPVKQWDYGHLVRGRRHLKLGDLLFWKEHGPDGPITHVGMYAGNGFTLQASSYFGKVVKSRMKWIDGYYGAKRVRPRL
jgi:cell wall-associated NlpC family hydrolase